MIGSQHQQDAVPLDPTHGVPQVGPEEQTFFGGVQDKGLRPAQAVVQKNLDGPVHADQKLPQGLVRMSSPHAAGLHAIGIVHASDLEGDVAKRLDEQDVVVW